jgi:hypothetical protein
VFNQPLGCQFRIKSALIFLIFLFKPEKKPERKGKKMNNYCEIWQPISIIHVQVYKQRLGGNSFRKPLSIQNNINNQHVVSQIGEIFIVATIERSAQAERVWRMVSFGQESNALNTLRERSDV